MYGVTFNKFAAILWLYLTEEGGMSGTLQGTDRWISGHGWCLVTFTHEIDVYFN
jgi:hypothetical protein